jgi:hypothetical protein
MDWLVDFYNYTKEDLHNNNANFRYLIISFIIVLFFFLIKLFLNYAKLNKTNKNTTKLDDEKITLILTCLCEIFLATGINFIFIILFDFNGLLFGPVLGIIIAFIIENKFFKDDNKTSTIQKSSKNQESPTDSAEKEGTEGMNNTKNDNKREKDKSTHLNANHDVNFFNPDVDLEDGMNIDNLNITNILELYGYISPNQKYKMISSSIFETPDEQVKKLLDMAALEESELKEATAILNLIRLKKRLVSKEEVLKYIIENEKEEGGEN